jgi:hypothetical protein
MLSMIVLMAEVGHRPVGKCTGRADARVRHPRWGEIRYRSGASRLRPELAAASASPA